ncbi:MAG: Fis1 C-terminal tetratricopeptide repeat-containing protein [Mucilaginibacter sp.]|nr:Fis1 C-terminal tetratricopeptide repeat-containing protein [Mucilaginibacter sp.]
MLQGLYLYEIILMITGGILFLALVFALIWNVIKGKSIVSLLPFFFLPIVMIGWTAIKSFSYDNGKIDIEKTANEVAKNPADTTLRGKLEKSIAAFDTTRAANDPVALNNISSAYYALGKYNEASIYNQKALSINPGLPQAINLKAGIEKQVALKNNFEQSIQQLNNSVAAADTGKAALTPAATQKIVGILKTVKQPVYADEKSSLVIAKALALVNKKEQSMQVVNKVLEANPQSQESLQLKKNIETGKFKTVAADSAQTKSLDSKKFNFIIKKAPPVKQ